MYSNRNHSTFIQKYFLILWKTNEILQCQYNQYQIFDVTLLLEIYHLLLEILKKDSEKS